MKAIRFEWDAQKNKIGRINFKVHHLRKACDMTGILVC